MKFSVPTPRVLMVSSLAGLSLLGGFAALSIDAAPTPINRRELSTRVEEMDALPAARIARGLGFNVNLNREWEFARAREAGATEARIQFDWTEVEKTAGNLVLPPKMARALDLCAQNDLEPLVLAVYGPAYRAVAELTLRENVPAGSKSLPVDGDLRNVNVEVPFCHVLRSDLQSNRKQIVAEGRWAYYGALIDEVNSDNENGALQLAAKTSVALSKGTKLRVNRLLYPSVATQDADDPSLVAFGRYARFLASEISRRGLVGNVELWNEPPWSHDRWDARGGFYEYEDIPRGISATSPNPGMLDQFLNGAAPPRGTRFVWGGANKSGGRGLGARRGEVTPAMLRRIGADSIHPYGDAPEMHAWNPQDLRAGVGFENLALPGTNAKSNMKILRQKQVAAQKRGAPFVPMVITEVGEIGPDEARRARYNLRAFLVYLSLGYERVNFFRLADAPQKYAFIDHETGKSYQPFVAFKSLMQKIEVMKGAPARFDADDLPSVISYRGTFPLLTIPIVGRAQTNARRKVRSKARNRILLVSYQRTFPEGKTEWKQVPSPAAAPVQLRIPQKMKVVKVWNLVSGADVAHSTKNESVDYAVSDDPIAVEFAPL